MPNFVTPEGWVEEAPANSMRKKQYSLPSEGGAQPALAVVAHWPNGVGTIEDNLNRWVSQVNSSAQASELSAEQRWTTEPDGYLVTHVHVEGQIKPAEGMAPDIATTEAGAILAAYVETVASPAVWTIKITGDAKTVQAHKERYLAFVAGM